MLQVVSGYFSGIFYTLQVLFFSKIVLESFFSLSKKQLIFIVLLFSGVYAFIFLTLDGIVKTLFFVLVGVVLHNFFLKVSVFKSLFMNFIYIFLLMIPDMLVFFGSINIFGMSKEYCYNVFAGSFLCNLIVFILYIFLISLINKPLKKLIDTQIDTDIKIVIFSILTIFCILLFFYTIIDKFFFTNDILLYLLCILVLVLSLSNLIKQVVENRRLSAKYDKLLEFMTTYEEEIERQRIMRHEIKNEFLVVRAKLLDNQKNEEIVNYIDEILKDKITVKQEHYAKFGYLPPNGIKGLCYLKVQQAESLDIKVSINISKKVRKFDINSLKISEQRNLARILGVFLDNAREACNVSQDKKMGLEVYYDEKNGLKFIISNTFNNVVDVDKIGKERFSTKGKGRGHGLMLVNYILESNKVFNLKTEINGNVYTQNLTVKIKTSK